MRTFRARKGVGRTSWSASAIALVAAVALFSLSVVSTDSAAGTMTEPSSELAKQMQSLAASAAAKESQRVLNDAILSPQVARALRASLRTFAGQMTPFEKSLVSAGALVGSTRYTSALKSLRSRHKLTAEQTKTLAKLLSAFAANPAVQVLIKRGKAVQASPKRLAALLAALRAQPTSIASRIPSTGIPDLDGVLSSVAGAVRSKATASVSKRFSTLLATPGAANYIKALPPLDVTALVPAYELATYTLPSTARASGTPPSTQSAWEAAVLSAEDELALGEAKVTIDSITDALREHGPSPDALVDLVETLERAAETLEQGTVPPKLELTSAQVVPWVAGVRYGFVVNGFWSNGLPMGPVRFGTLSGPTLEMTHGDGECEGATCTSVKAESHTVTALVGGSSTSLTLDVVPAQLHEIHVQERLAPFVDPLTVNVVGVPQEYIGSGTDAFGNDITGLSFDLSISRVGGSSLPCAGLFCTPVALGSNVITASYTVPETSNTITGSVAVYVAPVSLGLSPEGASVSVGQAQHFTVHGLDGNGSDVGPDLNATLSISPDGTCTGYTCTASTAGAHIVTATDGTAKGSAILNVEGIKISPATLPEATEGEPYSATLTAEGGEKPYTWALASGSLPEGLSLDPGTGVISGTASNAGESTFDVIVTDSLGATATAGYKIKVMQVTGPCTVRGGGLASVCQSASPHLTLDLDGYGEASSCTFSTEIDWGDGSPVQTVMYLGNGAPVGNYEAVLFTTSHTYSAPGAYTIATAVSGVGANCGWYDGPYRFTYMP